MVGEALRLRFANLRGMFRMWCTKLRRSAFAGFLIVLALFAWNSSVGPAADEPKPASEPAWKTEFRTAYRLKDGEILKRVAAPFPACRKEYCRSLKIGNGDSEVDDIVLSYRWDGRNVYSWRVSFQQTKPIGWALINVLRDVGVPNQDVEGDTELLRQHIDGEFVVRTGVPPEKLVPRLEQILREELDLPIHLALTQEEREVIVVGGKYKSKPRADRNTNMVDLFAVAPRNDTEAGGGNGTFDEFLKATGSYISRRLVSDLAAKPRGQITWYYHNRVEVLPGPDPNLDADGVLKNVAAQTGLTFKPEKRKVRVLLVKKT
jgi:hypothetical protein